jgi:hypothetical protein
MSLTPGGKRTCGKLGVRNGHIENNIRRLPAKNTINKQQNIMATRTDIIH